MGIGPNGNNIGINKPEIKINKAVREIAGQFSIINHKHSQHGQIK